MQNSPVFVQELFDAMEEAILVTDDNLDEPGPSIVYVNRAFEKISGYSQSEVLGRNPRFLQGPRTDRAMLDELRRCLRDRKPFRGRGINYRKGGAPFVNQWYIKPIEVDGRRLFVAIQRDVTEEQHLYALTQVTAGAQNAAFMVAGLRHELGNPINSLKAAVSFLRSQFTTLTQERVDYYLAAMQREVARIERLLRGLRSMNAFETATPEWFGLASEVESVHGLVAPLLHQVNIRWSGTVSANVRVFADPQLFHQVLLNVVKNSIEALHEGGELEVSFAPEERALCVRDTGIGMTSAQMESLFSPFKTTKEGGSGLGLYLARRMAADMQCQLSVDSVAGEGTVVTLTLPPTLVDLS